MQDQIRSGIMTESSEGSEDSSFTERIAESLDTTVAEIEAGVREFQVGPPWKGSIEERDQD